MLGELGHGAGGKVYKALHVPTRKLVAVKVNAVLVVLDSFIHGDGRLFGCTIKTNAIKW